jgi:hypothetical protein
VTIFPLTEVVLTHRAYHVAVAESGHVVAVSQNGAGSLISPDRDTTTPFKVSFDPRNVAIAANGSLLAVTGENGLTIISTSTLKPSHRLDESFESSHFSSNGLLWCCARLDSQTVALEIMDPQTWRAVARTKITDPFSDSYFQLLPHPDPECVVAWAAGGQDGQSLFWARRNDRTIVIDRFPELDDTTWPSFGPTGKEFLVISGHDAEVRRYSYPRGPISARMQWPFEAEGDQIGDFVAFVDANHALLTSSNGRLFIADLVRMVIEDEIRIHGHEAKPLEELYPGLRGERGLGSDLSFFSRLPREQFLSIHRELPSPHPEDSHDHLLTWRIVLLQ